MDVTIKAEFTFKKIADKGDMTKAELRAFARKMIKSGDVTWYDADKRKIVEIVVHD